MDKFCGANIPQGTTGPENDFEVHPIGTAERARQIGIIGARASEILEEMAQDLKDSETINGAWPTPGDEFSDKARADYEEWTATAGYLRALCAPPAAAPAPEAKPEFPPLRDEDFTIQIYPWPSGEAVVDD